jgi:hypothetical protein
MIEPASIESLKATVEGMHGGTATFVQAVPVREEFQGEPAWEGVVHVFDLAGNASASRAYAWSSSLDESDKKRIFAVLHIPPIASPTDAVRAAIVTESKAVKKKTPSYDCFVNVSSPATGEQIERRGFYTRADGQAYEKEMNDKGFDANLIPLR